MILRKFVTVSVAGACVCMANFAVAQEVRLKAQQRQQVKGQPQTGQDIQDSQRQISDLSLATCVAIGNQEEIAIAKFAEEKAHGQEVKDFAKLLVKEHQSFLKKLERYAPEATREGYLVVADQAESNDKQRTSTNQPKEVATPAKVQPAGGAVKTTPTTIQQTAGTATNSETNSLQHMDFVQLHREVAEECIRGSEMMLNKRDGTEFDECFIGMQIAKHAAMKSTLTVFERHASADLKQVFAEGLETTEKHMKKAEEIMRKLADAGISSSK